MMPTIKGVRQAGELSGSLELGQDKVIARYSLEYVVLADNTSQGPLTIRSTAGLPLVGLSTYSYGGESDTTAVCKRKTPRRDSKQPLVWYVRVEFDNDPSSQSQENEEDSGEATSRPPIVEWDSEFGEEVLYQDFDDPRKDILNPVGHQYDPPVTRRVIFPVLTIERYQATFTPVTILGYVDHINQDAFYGAAAGHALMTQIRARQVVEDGTKLWQVTYRVRFAVSEDGFKLRPLNQGSHYSTVAFAGDDSTLKPFIKDDVPYVGNLNADGTAATGGTRTYSEFVAYPSADFDGLSLE
jgi:hypothetical protein